MESMPAFLSVKTQKLLKTDSALQANSRITSIDILRATTMVLMIFVNDLGSIKNVPEWLEHSPKDADGMGVADAVFPAFLFIVGMSIPYAIENRRKKGDNNIQLVNHIGKRTFALLVMGVFLVNGENINATATGMPYSLWNSFSCISFILIWNSYSKKINPFLKTTLQGIGIAVLLTLAFLYRGGEAEHLKGFSTYWWGILGLIGWSYLTASLITVFAGKRTVLIVVAWLMFTVLSMLLSAGLLPKDSMLSIIPGPILGGTLVAFAIGGVLTTLIFQHYKKQYNRQLIITLFLVSTGLMILGIYTNRFWDISKIRATAPWLFLCSAFTIMAFIAVYWLVNLRQKATWFQFIKPAGTDTLLCYLIPYFAYAAIKFSGTSLPEILHTGAIGLLKSFVFALACVWVAGFLSRKGVRLKL